MSAIAQTPSLHPGILRPQSALPDKGSLPKSAISRPFSAMPLKGGVDIPAKRKPSAGRRISFQDDMPQGHSPEHESRQYAPWSVESGTTLGNAISETDPPFLTMPHSSSNRGSNQALNETYQARPTSALVTSKKRADSLTVDRPTITATNRPWSSKLDTKPLRPLSGHVIAEGRAQAHEGWQGQITPVKTRGKVRPMSNRK